MKPIIILCAALLCGCEEKINESKTSPASAALAETVHETNLPTGWSVVCDGRGHYRTRDEDGFIYGGDSDLNSLFTYTNKQGAIDNAWNWKRMMEDAKFNSRRKIYTGEWSKCE